MCTNTGMFLIRLAVGIVFVVQGWGKLSNLQGTIGFFAGMGIPAFLAYLISFGEFAGGVAMIAGVWTKWAGFGLAIIMAGAVYFTWDKGFIGGYALPFVLLLTALGISFIGPGTATIHALKKKL